MINRNQIEQETENAKRSRHLLFIVSLMTFLATTCPAFQQIVNRKALRIFLTIIWIFCNKNKITCFIRYYSHGLKNSLMQENKNVTFDRKRYKKLFPIESTMNPQEKSHQEHKQTSLYSIADHIIHVLVTRSKTRRDRIATSEIETEKSGKSM